MSRTSQHATDDPRSLARAVRRHPLVAATAGAIGVAGAVAGLALAGAGAPAAAGGQSPAPVTLIPVTTKPPVVTLAPGLTLPPAVTIVPGLTLPGLTVPITIVPVTLVPITIVPTTLPSATTTSLAPTTTMAATTTTVAATTTTGAPPTTTGGGDATTAPPATSAATPGAPELDGFTLEILAGTLDCSGSLTLQYATTAPEDWDIPVDHALLFTPLSNPTAIGASALNDNKAISQFAVVQPLPVAEPYRVLVVASFDPDNIDGPKLVDQIDVAPPTDCP